VSFALLDALKVRRTIPVEIGGMLFTPGTYRPDNVIITAAGVVITLDGQNDPNSVFLFQATGGGDNHSGLSWVLLKEVNAAFSNWFKAPPKQWIHLWRYL
jgi:hypothetical protein